jgi:hypothetical protein
MTCFRTVTVKAVIAECVVRDVIARVAGLVARVVGAANTIVAIDRRARLAIVSRIARLRSIAEQPIVAQRIFRDVVAGIGPFIA